MKIAFDFDGTLDREDVQTLAQQIIDLGHQVEIVTTRWDEDKKHKYHFWNTMTADEQKNLHKPVYDAAKKLNVPYHFTNMEWKAEFLRKNNFEVLIDDNRYEEKPRVERVGIRFVSAAYNNKQIKQFVKELKKIAPIA